MLLEIPVPERCEECERLEAELEKRRNAKNKSTLDIELDNRRYRRWEISFNRVFDHRGICRVWLAAHE